MIGARLWQCLRLIRMLSLVLLILTGCGGSGGTGTRVESNSRSLVVQMALLGQTGAGSVRRAQVSGQARQGNVASLTVTVTDGRTFTGTVTCTIPDPPGDPCTVTATSDAFIVEVTIADVPSAVDPNALRVAVSVRNRNNVEIARGEGQAVGSRTTVAEVTAAVTITLTPVPGANTPPQANAGRDQTAFIGETVFLRGDASTDVDGDELAFGWSFLSVPPGSAATLSDPGAVNSTFVVDQPGDYVLALIVSDVLEDSEPAIVVISTVNSAPVADAGPDQTVAVGETAVLHGSGSTDVDGDLLHFSWSFVAFPPGSTATLDNPHAVTPSFVADVPGTYIVQLVVNDGLTNSEPAFAIISTVNSAPVAEAGDDLTATAGETVTLDGSESFDADENPLTFIWALIVRPPGSTAALVNANTFIPSFVVDVPGTYVVQLIVNDGTTNSEPDTVTISTENSFPKAEAGPAQVVSLGSTVVLDGSDSFDADGEPLFLFWSLIVVPPNSTAQLDNPFAVTPSFVADQPGDYVAQLIAFDGLRFSEPDTVQVTVPVGIGLALAGISGNTVIVGVPASLIVILPAPAPADGVLVTITSDNPGVVAIDTPGTVFISAGMTTGQIGVSVLTTGFTTLRATAPDFPPGSLDISVIPPSLVSLPTTLNVAPGQSMSIPVTLASGPAPPGGVMVELISSDASVQFVTSTGALSPIALVTIPAGAISTNAQVRGVTMGSATITGRAGGVPVDSTQVTSMGNLNVPSSTFLDASFPISVTIQLESNSRVFAAPSTGVEVTLTAGDPGCVAVTSPVTITAGRIHTQATLSYGGVTALPCSTTVTVTAPNMPAANINVSVGPVPQITILGSNIIGAGLQTSCCSISLTSANHGGTTVRLQSTPPGLLLFAPDDRTAGTATLDLVVPAGQSFAGSFVVQGMEDTSGAVTVTASAPGFRDGSINITVVEPALRLSSLPLNTTVLSGESDFVVEVGVSSGSFFTQAQQVRVGSMDRSVTLTSGTPAVGLLRTTANGTVDTVMVSIAQGQSTSPFGVASGGVAFVPTGGGEATVTAAMPSLTSQTGQQDVMVAAMPAITVSSSAISNTVGAGLQVVCCTVDLGASAHGGVTVRIQSNDPSRVRVAPDTTTAGEDFFDVTVSDGQGAIGPFVVQGMEGTSPLPSGPVTISVFDTAATAATPRFMAGSIDFTVVEPVLRLNNLPANTTTLSGESDSDFVTVEVGVPFSGTTIFAQPQEVRFGSYDATATVTSDTPTVGLLRTTAAGTMATVEVPIAQGQSHSPLGVAAGGLAFVPVGGGTTIVNATVDGLTTQTASRGVTVDGMPPIDIFGFPTTVGAGLQAFCCNVDLNVAQHGGVTVRLTSSDPARLLLAPNLTTAGSATLDLMVPNGQSFAGSFAIQALEGAGSLPAQVMITASAPGFTDATLDIMIVQPELRISGSFSNLTTLSGDTPFVVQVGVFSIFGLSQPVRFGGPPLTAIVSNSNPIVGQLRTASTLGQTAMVAIPAGQASSPFNVGSGGVAFDPLTTGDTTLTATITGIGTATTPILMTVTPGITLFSAQTTVGAGLQFGALTVRLGAPNHGGVTLRLESSNEAVALVSPNATTPGARFVDINIPNGSTDATYFIQGVEGAMGSVALMASAPGFIDGIGIVSVTPPALQLSGLPTSIGVAAADTPFRVSVGIPNFGLGTLSQFQAVRAGGSTLTLTLISSLASVGQLVTTGGSGSTVTVQIPPGMSSSPFIVAAGGVAFDPLTTGSTEVRVVSPPPGFILTKAAAQTVNILP